MSTSILGEKLDESGFKLENDEFEKTADEAMQIAGVLKESDLSEYIPHGDGSLSKDIFSRMKEINRKELAELIRKNVIEKEPKKYSPSIPKTQETSFGKMSLGEVIKLAAKKVGAHKPSGICFYIPYEEKRLHHGTMETLSKKNPELLKTLIIDHVLSKKPQKYGRDLEALEANATQVPSSEDRKAIEEALEKAFKRRSLKIKDERHLQIYPLQWKIYPPTNLEGLEEKRAPKISPNDSRICPFS